MWRWLVPAVLLFLGGCASLPADVRRDESHALADTGSTRIGQAATAILKEHPGENGFRPLQSGVDALLARIALADSAERSLDVQYYIWHDDLTGRHFAHALLRAADRGVRVRILLDDLGVNPKDENLLSLDSHANVEIRLFNPVASRTWRNLSALTDFSRVNRRMHNKAFIADNRAAILGGRNIGDEYFGASGEVAFGDLDVLAIGPSVSEVSAAFDLYWNAPQSFPVSALMERSGDPARLTALRAELGAFIEAQHDSPYVSEARGRFAQLMSPVSKAFYWGRAHLLYDDPGKVGRAREETAGNLLPQFANIGAKVQKELLIVSPYFVPGDAGVAWLKALVDRGIRVTVLTNSLAATDVGAVHAGYQQYREALLAGGVKLYEFKPSATGPDRPKGEKKSDGGSRASLHAKTFVFDRRAVFIGSLNLDPRSVQLNTEIGVVCESATMAEELGGKIERNLDRIAWRLERVVDSAGSAHIVWTETDERGVRQLTKEPEVSAWRRFSVWFLGLLPIEEQL